MIETVSVYCQLTLKRVEEYLGKKAVPLEV
jgi:hypothetical protein